MPNKPRKPVSTKKPQQPTVNPVNINLSSNSSIKDVLDSIEKSSLSAYAKRKRMKQALANDKAIRLSRQGTIKAVGSAFAQNTAAPTATWALSQSNSLINAVGDNFVSKGSKDEASRESSNTDASYRE